MKNYSSKSGESKIIVFVPYPAQGHVTPMLNLAKAFLNLDQGFRPVFVTPRFIHDQIVARYDDHENNNHMFITNDHHHQTNNNNDSIEFVAIPDGFEGKSSVARDFFSLEEAMEKVMPAHLERVVRDQGEDVVCVVVDLLASWAIEVANRCGIRVAGFWPAMLAVYRLVVAIPDMVRSGLISDTGCPQHLYPISFLPNQPILSTEEFPWLIGTLAARKARFKFWTRTLARSRTLQWILANSFPDEESLNDEKLNKELLPLVLPISPLSKNLTTKNPSLWEEDNSCLDWLDKQKSNSVIYISFGSWVSPIGESKVRTLAMALESLGHFFIWVLSNSWRAGLPVGFEERVSNRSKIVSWAPQMEVLRHRAVGFYLTHCGWNSTMEAIQSQKRLLCYPIAGDQFVNCNYIVKVWKIGVRINGVGLKEVEEGLRKVMEDKEMELRLKKMYERTMGDEACRKATSNLRIFGNFLSKQTLLGSSFVSKTSF
ncbi:hypothetical protein F8388_021290 [Cannabis sativa]|uniref:Glycosyltransferase n=1 Tax=Cannabis sativa TaxID=3483 RepID=A0A7J6GFN6_CANSA|nr:hypothetical protein F8388_021290 [Cannabis sativa]